MYCGSLEVKSSLLLPIATKVLRRTRHKECKFEMGYPWVVDNRINISLRIAWRKCMLAFGFDQRPHILGDLDGLKSHVSKEIVHMESLQPFKGIP